MRGVLRCVLAVAILCPAAAFAGFAGTDIYLPSVGSAVGVSPWYTTVWVYNPNSSPATITVHLLKRQANPSPSAFTDVIPAGDTRRYDDAVSFMFHESAFGALRITADHKVLVSSRVWSRQPTATERDSTGHYFGGLPVTFAIGAGQKTQIVGARQTSSDKASSDFRFNVGVVETPGQPCTLTLQLVDATGAPAGSPRTWNLGPREQKQDSVWNLFSTAVENHRVEIEVTGGSGQVLAFGSSVANGSDDPSTVEMHFADSLLAEGEGFSVVHDGSLSGAGTTEAPLAVADGGVQGRHLAAGAVGAGTIADGTVVRALNGLTERVTLQAGSNVSLTSSGQTITVSATPGASGTITGVPAGFADGTDDDTTYTAGSGLTLTGTQFALDTAVVQARVSGTCAAGSSIRVVNADGTVTCETVGGAYWSLVGNGGTSPATSFVGTTDAQPLVSRTANTERMRLDASGRLGIGTVPSSLPLTIRGSGPDSAWLQLMDSGGANQWHLNYLDGGLNFAETGVSDFRLYLEDGGEVGIGTGAPNSRLHVQNSSGAVTGIRRDPYAQEHPIVVEQAKQKGQQGTYLCPECYGLARGAVPGEGQHPRDPAENPTR